MAVGSVDSDERHQRYGGSRAPGDVGAAGGDGVGREFGQAMVRGFGAPAGQLGTFIDVPFKAEDRTIYPDGVLQASRAGRTWTCLVEVKTGGSELERPQVEAYLDVARENDFDCVLTISWRSRAGAHLRPRDRPMIDPSDGRISPGSRHSASCRARKFGQSCGDGPVWPTVALKDRREGVTGEGVGCSCCLRRLLTPILVFSRDASVRRPAGRDWRSMFMSTERADSGRFS